MLQMTWPDDQILDETYVKDLIRYLEKEDDSLGVRSPKNPFRRTLRKLWALMTESDYRTKLKAIMLLHHMSTDLGPASSTRVRNHFMRMREETNLKNRNEVYFEQGRLLDVSSSGVPFLPLLKSYGSFTFRRMVAFKGGSQRLQDALNNKETTQAEAVALLHRIDKVICQGTTCKIVRKTSNKITVDIIRLTALDIMNLWRLYVKGLTKLVKGNYSEEEEVDSETLQELLAQYPVTNDTLRKYLELYGTLVKDQSMFEDNQIDLAALEGGAENACAEEESVGDNGGKEEAEYDHEGGDYDVYD
ncbi:unnamed protein product [Discosporangium mesarthrocarpum]